MTIPSPQIRFVVALPSEAKPINRHFGLVRNNKATQYSVYRNRGIALVISGVGSEASGRATHWLQKMLPEPAIWINAGIAGHSHLPVGAALLASEILHRPSGKRWQTRLPASPPCGSAPLITCAEPETGYSESALYDMEAAGFYDAASAAAPAQRIHCFKIVSDNPQSPVHSINREMITQLMNDQLHLLEQLSSSGI
jgi:adenosylhomocysteine nucleosidase